jgi:hypothetical protein
MHSDGFSVTLRTTWYRIGVAETLKKSSTWVAGGQYQMPFRYEIQKSIARRSAVDAVVEAGLVPASTGNKVQKSSA